MEVEIKKMNAIFQTTFSMAFSWMKMYEFRLKFCLCLKAQLTKFQHWFRKWLGVYQATSHYLKQWWLDYWRIYALLGLSQARHVNMHSTCKVSSVGVKDAHIFYSICYIFCLNTLRPRQDDRYFADDVLKCIFLNEDVCILLKIPLKFVPRGPIFQHWFR